MPKGPRAGEEPRGHPKFRVTELSPGAGAMPAGAGPAPPPPQLRQRGEGTDAIPARAGDALPVPKDIHAAVPTICSLAALPARAPAPRYRLSAGTGVTPCSKHRPPGTALTPLKTPWEEGEEGFAPIARSFQLPTALLQVGLTWAPPAALIPSLLGAPGEGQAATSLPSPAPTHCRSLNAFLGQG